MVYLLFALGLGLLVVGAEMLVRGASLLAVRVGLPPLVIGLTVVAFGTSSPELVVSLKAAIDGLPGIVVGNVVGSNIFNVLLILGFAALVAPLVVSSHLLRYDVPLMILVSTAIYMMSWNRVIGRLEGLLLVAVLVCYTGAMIYFGDQKDPGEDPDKPPADETPARPPVRSSLKWNLIYIFGGLGMLILGSHWLVQSGVVFARWMGVSDLVIGLTVVAAGTSLPELVTSVIASIRGERDIAVGNIVGSNLFNILGVLGLTALIAPDGVNVAPAAVAFDLPVMVAVAIVCLPIFFTGGEIARWEGALLVIYYIIYTIYLVLAATKDDDLEAFGEIVMWYVIRPTVLSLIICVLLAWRRKWLAQRAQSAESSTALR